MGDRPLRHRLSGQRESHALASAVDALLVASLSLPASRAAGMLLHASRRALVPSALARPSRAHLRPLGPALPAAARRIPDARAQLRKVSRPCCAVRWSRTLGAIHTLFLR